MNFLKYELTAEALVLGERPKAGTFLPCVQTIPYSQITGALRHHFGNNPSLHAAGHLVKKDGHNLSEWLTYSPRDKVADISKVPLQVQFLTNVVGRIYVLENEAAKRLPEEFPLSLGGFRSRGFGDCHLRRLGTVDVSDPQRGLLNTRIPEKRLGIFNIRSVQAPVYGYLWEPDANDPLSGVYVLSLFEGSLVDAPSFLVQPPEVMEWTTLRNCARR